MGTDLNDIISRSIIFELTPGLDCIRFGAVFSVISCYWGVSYTIVSCLVVTSDFTYFEMLLPKSIPDILYML